METEPDDTGARRSTEIVAPQLPASEAEATAESHVAASLPEGWQLDEASDGTPVYHNAALGMTQWGPRQTATNHWRRGRDVTVAIHRMKAVTRTYIDLPACKPGDEDEMEIGGDAPVFKYDPLQQVYVRINEAAMLGAETLAGARRALQRAESELLERDAQLAEKEASTENLKLQLAAKSASAARLALELEEAQSKLTQFPREARQFAANRAAVIKRRLEVEAELPPELPERRSRRSSLTRRNSLPAPPARPRLSVVGSWEHSEFEALKSAGRYSGFL